MNKACTLIAAIVFVTMISPTPSFSDRGVGLKVSGNTLSSSLGTYHALIVGINDYQEWPRLKTAVKDATELKTVLIKLYGFDDKNITFLTDKFATRSRIILDLRNLATNLQKTDNLLIYFAGHGQLDDLTGDGYWIPAEGKLKNPATWISHSVLKNILGSEKFRAKNVVVVLDSCYSGTLLREGPSMISMNEKDYSQKLIQLSSRRSRQVITSGGLEPVADGGRDGHSLFAYYFLKALRENTMNIIDIENLFHAYVWKPVTEISGQRPNVGRLKTPMDEDGQFVLELRSNISQDILKIEHTKIEKKRQQLEREKQEIERLKLEIENKKLQAERERLEKEKRNLISDEKAKNTSRTHSSAITKIASQKGSYERYSNGIVYDSNTGLEWYVGPDEETTWNEASRWAQTLRVAGGGWRMPTKNELKTLYKKGVGNRNMTPLLQTTGWWVWSGEKRDLLSAWGIFFGNGNEEYWFVGGLSETKRGFAVRSKR